MTYFILLHLVLPGLVTIKSYETKDQSVLLPANYGTLFSRVDYPECGKQCRIFIPFFQTQELLVSSVMLSAAG